MRQSCVFGLFLTICWSATQAAPPQFITPDEADLIRGVHTLQDGFPNDAFDKFTRAARYGNKEAQKNIGIMYVQGIGVSQNWSRAYCWLKLASSAGDPAYIAAREEVRKALRPDELGSTRQICMEIVEEFGDLQALKRRERWIRRQKREVTGSRLGSMGALRIKIADATGYEWELAGDTYFGILDTYVSSFEAKIGTVSFGELELLEEDQGEN